MPVESVGDCEDLQNDLNIIITHKLIDNIFALSHNHIIVDLTICN